METERVIKISLKGFNPKQREIAYDIINTSTDIAKFFAIRASRKAGKTWMLARLIFYFCIKQANIEIGFLTASDKFKRDFYMDLMKIIPKQTIEKTNINELIIFKNGSILYLYSAGSTVIPVNKTYNYLICDEFALFKKDVWTYIKPTVLANKLGKVIVASTPRGKNHFYDMCMLGIENKERHRHYRMHYTDNPNIDLLQVENDRLSTPTPLFLQEYEAEFTDAISGVFGHFKNLLVINEWEEFKTGIQYFFGLDIAGTGADKTVLTIMDQYGNIVYIYECINEDFVKQANEISPIIKKYNAVGYGEKTGLGQGLIDIIRSHGCNITYWNSDNTSKQRLVTNLILNINKETIKLPTANLCPKLENEMSCYSGKRTSSGLIKYEGDDGVHDDYVMSLMLANEARRMFLDNNSIIYDTETIINDINIELKNRVITPAILKQAQTSWVDSLKYD